MSASRVRVWERATRNGFWGCFGGCAISEIISHLQKPDYRDEFYCQDKLCGVEYGPRSEERLTPLRIELPTFVAEWLPSTPHLSVLPIDGFAVVAVRVVVVHASFHRVPWVDSRHCIFSYQEGSATRKQNLRYQQFVTRTNDARGVSAP
jgi:hypothetical protein